jgi:hypothetical protein
MLEEKAKDIVDIIGDYENNEMTVAHIVEWVSQFDEPDREFILNELTGIFGKTYFSKAKCYKILKEYLEYLAGRFKYQSVKDFLGNAIFLDVQAEHKSQKDLLSMLDEILQKEFKTQLALCGKNEPKHFIYLDDVLATGNKIFFDLEEWFKGTSNFDGSKTNYEFLKANKLRLNVCVICCHTWGYSNVDFRLSKLLNEKAEKVVEFFRYYEIENNLKEHDAKLNLVYPCDEQPNEVKLYLNSLEYAIYYEDRAFRKKTFPKQETLFSSPENRIRLENIFLMKGLEILKHVENLKAKGMRPLGFTMPKNKTLGLGTLFFTYRNIPNNCPIIFWWSSNYWKPLFVLKNRG